MLTFAAMLLGISLVVASGCVCNNYLDRSIDAKMARTRHRALVQGSIGVGAALWFAGVLGIAGTLILLLFTNALTTIIAWVGFVAYVAVYGFAKRRTVHSTVVGSFSGAIPPVVGYAAVTNRLDLGAILIFLVLVFWQMPHFYAIALYRREEYAAARLPVLPLVKGALQTKIQMLVYIVAFAAAAIALWLFGYTGLVFAVIVGLLSLGWLRLAIKGFHASDDNRWARGMFGYSLLTIAALCATIPLDSWLR